MDKKLLILPGGGDPKSTLYIEVYELITREAKKRGFEKIEVMSWPGHLSYDNTSYLSFPECCLIVKNKIIEYELDETQYSVIARSYGTGVFLKAIENVSIKHIRFASLWGMPSYLSFYDLFKENIISSSNNSLKKGLRINEECCNELIPYELLLKQFNNDFQLNVITGEKDKYSTPGFMDFLKTVNTKSNIFYDTVSKMIHEVIEYDKDYIEAIFHK